VYNLSVVCIIYAFQEGRVKKYISEVMYTKIIQLELYRFQICSVFIINHVFYCQWMASGECLAVGLVVVSLVVMAV